MKLVAKRVSKRDTLYEKKLQKGVSLMNPTVDIKADAMVFDKLIEPLEALLREVNKMPISKAAKKLGFALFVRILLYRIFAEIKGLRELARDLQSNERAEQLSLKVVAVSTIHDAFVRYPISMFAMLSKYLIENLKLKEIAELEGLGQLWCVDSSYWPIIYGIGWLKTEGLKGVRLHLALSLNTLCPAMFMVSYDKSPSSTERKSLLEMAQAGVTYIMDRGYVNTALYLQLIEVNSFFVIRERNNLSYRVLTQLDIHLASAYGFLSSVSDCAIKLNRDNSSTIYRLVYFVVCGHQYYLLTNRWDLTTQQIIMLYAWRWQVELIFRAWKHTFGSLHLINLSECGIAIQFHVMFIASMLWVAFHQHSLTLLPVQQSNVLTKFQKKKPASPTAIFGIVFRVLWRISKPLLQLLHNSLASPFTFYTQKLIDLRL